MKYYPCHININEAEGYVFTTGVEFRVFINALPQIPNGILMLKGTPENAQFDLRTCLEYISQEDMPLFLLEDVYNYGDFCWADFQSEGDLNKITDEELSELLFAAHLKKPLTKSFFPSLNNEYLYLCHDDEYWVKIYMRDVKAYKTVIEQKIRSVFMGRKRSMTPIPDDILSELYHFFIGGGTFDFENCTVSSIHTGVRMYPAKNVGLCEDNIHKSLDRQRNIMGIGRYLEYNPKTKKWALL